MSGVFIELPESTLAGVRHAAARMHRPTEELLSQLIQLSLDVEALPDEERDELLEMAWLDNRRLWQIARSQLTSQQQKRLTQLSQHQSEASFSLTEQNELNELRHEYGRMTLHKARAFAILSLRGGRSLYPQLDLHGSDTSFLRVVIG